MATYAVPLSADAIEDQDERLLKEFLTPLHYRVSERFYLVRADVVSSDVAEKLGLTDAEGLPGSVFKLNRAYSGWDRRTMWE